MKRLVLVLLVLLLVVAFARPSEAHLLYFTYDTAAPQTIADSGAWDDYNGSTERLMSGSKGSTTLTTGSKIDITEDQFEWDEMDRRYVSPPMNSGHVLFGGSNYYTVIAMTREYANTDDVVYFCHVLRIMSKDGATQRQSGNLFCNGPNEFINNVNHRTRRAAYSVSRNQYTTQQGDRLVLELGYRTDGAESTPQASAKWGESAADCPNNETTTTACSGWFEILNVTITFESEGPTRRRVMQTGWLDTIKMWFGPKEALAEFVR